MELPIQLLQNSLKRPSYLQYHSDSLKKSGEQTRTDFSKFTQVFLYGLVNDAPLLAGTTTFQLTNSYAPSSSEAIFCD